MSRSARSSTLGVVVIGRNEGARLARCLGSLRAAEPGGPIVYVDSGSADGSVELARAQGADVVVLDPSSGFTMARGRNAGIRRLLERMPELELIQFLDGDCELQPGWLEQGRLAMQARPDAAVVSGRRRERHRDANLYHRLMDMEWDTPIGEVDACHGDAMMRVAFLRTTGLFDESLIAGEEPELCERLRAAGGRILRLPVEMSLHDAAIDRFRQWWRRGLRSGHAEAQGAARHGWSRDRAATRALLRPWLWVFFFPLAILASALVFGGWALAATLVYPLHSAKIALARWRRGDSLADSALYALFVLIGRVPTWLGHWSFWLTRLRGRPSALIEYKGDARGAT
jgi:GT2 family glycosyltransferase